MTPHQIKMDKIRLLKKRARRYKEEFDTPDVLPEQKERAREAFNAIWVELGDLDISMSLVNREFRL